jgi:hypothetical protein
MRASVLLLLLVVPATSLPAQLDPRVRSGARVRVQTSGSERVLAIGRLTSIENDTLVVERSAVDAPLRIGFTDVAELAVHRRGKNAEEAGIALGVVSALAGGAMYVKWCFDNPAGCRDLEEQFDDPEDEDDDSSASPLLTAMVGFGAIGYFIGQALVPPSWQIVHLPLRIGIVPLQRGIGVFASVPAPRFVRGSR